MPLLVDSDRHLAEQLVVGAANWGLRAEATNLSAARNRIYQDHPNVVLLDLDLPTQLRTA